jgi:hypothetical protein
MEYGYFIVHPMNIKKLDQDKHLFTTREIINYIQHMVQVRKYFLMIVGYLILKNPGGNHSKVILANLMIEIFLQLKTL